MENNQSKMRKRMRMRTNRTEQNRTDQSRTETKKTNKKQIRIKQNSIEQGWKWMKLIKVYENDRRWQEMAVFVL